jgi:MOSC domain-containing protein YiiM
MTSPSDVGAIEIVSVNVAQPGFLGEWRGMMIESGIRKKPVQAESIFVSECNIEGDRQADLRVHGGAEKAVYAYPTEHLPVWTLDLAASTLYGPGSFGENLLVAGWLENDVFIGDVWAWGEARLQVCQPRYPCFKLGMATGNGDVIELMVENGRTGWYLRVLQPGTAPVRGPATMVERGPAGVTVRMAHLARLPGADRSLVERVAAVDALASGFKAGLLARLRD